MRLFPSLALAGLLLALSPAAANAQKLDFDDVGDVRTTGSGPILQGDEVLGYYFMYELGADSRKERIYALNFTDADLNTLQTKRLTMPRNTIAYDARFNGEAICLTLVNPQERTVEFVTYDRSGERLGKRSFEFKARAFGMLSYYLNLKDEDPGPPLVNPVPGEGFAVYLPTTEKGIGYDLHFLPNDLATSGGWMMPHVAKRGKFQDPTSLLATEDFILTSVLAAESQMKAGSAISLIEARSVKDGSLLFEMIPGKGSPSMAVTNAFYDADSEQITLGGTYFPAKANLNKDRSTGLALQRIDLKGKRIESARVTWAKAFVKVGRKNTEHLKNGGMVYLHRVLPGADGGLVAIGEYFDTEVSALGIASKMLSGNEGSSVKKVVLQDLFAFEFDSTLAFVDATMYPKPSSDVALPSGGAFIAPTRIARVLDQTGKFDYSYSMSFPDRNFYTLAYTSRENVDGKLFRQPKFNIVTKYGDQDKPTEVQLDEKAPAKVTSLRYYPAKPGYVMVTAYSRKEKTIESRLERID